MPKERNYNQARGFTLATLRQERGCIISLRGEVFDVTKFLAYHPGGANTLERCHGEEMDDILIDGNHRDIIDDALKSSHIQWLGILLDGKAPLKDENLKAVLEDRNEGSQFALKSLLKRTRFSFFSSDKREKTTGSHYAAKAEVLSEETETALLTA